MPCCEGGLTWASLSMWCVLSLLALFGKPRRQFAFLVPILQALMGEGLNVLPVMLQCGLTCVAVRISLFQFGLLLVFTWSWKPLMFGCSAEIPHWATLSSGLFPPRTGGVGWRGQGIAQKQGCPHHHACLPTGSRRHCSHCSLCQLEHVLPPFYEDGNKP